MSHSIWISMTWFTGFPCLQIFTLVSTVLSIPVSFFFANKTKMDDGVRHRRPDSEGVIKPAPTVPSTPSRFDNNKYNTRKTLAKGLLDVALLSNNVSNLKQLLKHQGTERQHPFFEWIVGGLLLSICLQVSDRLWCSCCLCRSHCYHLPYLLGHHYRWWLSFDSFTCFFLRWWSRSFWCSLGRKTWTRKKTRIPRCDGTIFWQDLFFSKPFSTWRSLSLWTFDDGVIWCPNEQTENRRIAAVQNQRSCRQVSQSWSATEPILVNIPISRFFI